MMMKYWLDLQQPHAFMRGLRLLPLMKPYPADDIVSEDYSAVDVDSQGPSSANCASNMGDKESIDSDSLDNDSCEPLKTMKLKREELCTIL